MKFHSHLALSIFTLTLSLQNSQVDAQTNTSSKTVETHVKEANENQVISEEERQFRIKNHIKDSQKLSFYVLSSEEEFTKLVEKNPSYQIKINHTEQLVVISLSAEDLNAGQENTQNKTNNTSSIDEKNQAALKRIAGLKQDSKNSFVYRIQTNFNGFEQAKNEKRNFSKFMKEGDPSIKYIEQSEAEKQQMDAMLKAYQAQKQKIKLGDSFPAFNLSTNQGQQINNAHFQGKLTLINFFFDTCLPCIKETPELNRFAKNHPDIQVLAMTTDSLAQAKQYVSDHGFEWKIAVQIPRSLQENLGIFTFPHFALVDANGKLLGLKSSNADGTVEQNLEKWIKELTDGKSL